VTIQTNVCPKSQSIFDLKLTINGRPKDSYGGDFKFC